MSTYAFITQSTKMLKNLGQWLDKAAQHAKGKKVEPDTLVDARLVFDQYALVKQVQSACDNAKFAAAYLSGKEAPAHPDTERTMTELHDRIKKAVAYLETFKAEDFAGAEERKVAPKWLGGKWLRGEDYVNEVSTPNFFPRGDRVRDPAAATASTSGSRTSSGRCPSRTDPSNWSTPALDAR
jgi:hypothetical protein